MSNRRRSYVAAVVLVLGAASSLIGGYALGWYYQIGWYDKAVHAFVSFGIAMYIGALLDPALGGAAIARPWRVALAACAALTLGLVWELLEWFYDGLASPMVEIFPKNDTMLDFLYDGLGAITGGAVGILMGQKRLAIRTKPVMPRIAGSWS